MNSKSVLLSIYSKDDPNFKYVKMAICIAVKKIQKNPMLLEDAFQECAIQLPTLISRIDSEFAPQQQSAFIKRRLTGLMIELLRNEDHWTRNQREDFNQYNLDPTQELKDRIGKTLTESIYRQNAKVIPDEYRLLTLAHILEIAESILKPRDFAILKTVYLDETTLDETSQAFHLSTASIAEIKSEAIRRIRCALRIPQDLEIPQFHNRFKKLGPRKKRHKVLKKAA